MHTNIILKSTPRSLKWFYFWLSNKTYVFTYFPMRVTCPAHIILLDLINQKIILCEEYKF
jgi:hypothetical protein